MDHDLEDHDRGLAFDLGTLRSRAAGEVSARPLNRRRALTLLGGAGLLALVGCGSDGDDASDASGGSSSTSTSAGSGGSSAECPTIPEETAGPFPGDGSNGPDALGTDGVVRSDITSSFGDASGVAEGVPLTIDLTVVDSGNGCAALAGAAVYVWHCDREGGYSMYSRGVTEENYLRGVQETDGDGRVTFTSIFPAAYQGRWPHIHFEVYPSLDEATGGGDPLVTSQLALPQAACEVVYAEEGYEDSVENLASTSLEGDNVFSDGSSQQLADTTGSVEDGYKSSLSVPV